MTTGGIIATVIFVATYLLIASEKVHKTKAALAGAVAMLLVRIVDQHVAFHGTETILGIDWNTVFLLIGMMTIASTTGRTGAFQWVAIKAAKLAGGRPYWIIVLLAVGTAVLSAGLDNATTVVLMAPVTILICEALAVDPVPFLICVVLSSNIGGTATLIGDPPNIMIGSAAHFSFVDFLKIDTPIAIAVLIAFLIVVWGFLRPRIKVDDERRQRLMEFDESRAITDPVLLRKCVIVGLLTLGGFCVHDLIHLEPATIALAGAVVLMLLQKNNVEEAFHGVEWSTIFFIIGLFIMVAALTQTGVITLLTDQLVKVAASNWFIMTMAVLVLSAFISGLIGNIALVAAMNAIMWQLAARLHPDLQATPIAMIHAPDMIPLWWALSIGSCFGGNSTLLGTAANVAVAGIAERSGYPITFGRFLKYGIPITLMSVAMGGVYLWILFLR